jgi:hypothetical protein
MSEGASLGSGILLRPTTYVHIGVGNCVLRCPNIWHPCQDFPTYPPEAVDTRFTAAFYSPHRFLCAE